MIVFPHSTLPDTRCWEGLRLRIKKKIAAAVYEYQADCDGEWGEIQVDFVSGTAEIVRLAEWDTMVSKVFAKRVIRYLMQTPPEKISKTELIPFKEI